MPIYFVRCILQGVELGYFDIEKLLLSLVNAAWRLRRYFLALSINVLTNALKQQVLLKPEKSGRLAKRVVKLGEHEINYKPRTSVMAQALMDFITKIKNKGEVLTLEGLYITNIDNGQTQEEE